MIFFNIYNDNNIKIKLKTLSIYSILSQVSYPSELLAAPKILISVIFYFLKDKREPTQNTLFWFGESKTCEFF